MAKEKLQIYELSEILAEQLRINRKSAEEFLKVFASVIEEQLISGEQVKIKGLGTFKLNWNEPRKSVDVNTGAEIIIEGYYKVNFTPETLLKDAINEPFSHLSAVVIEDHEITNTEKSSAPAMDPLRVMEEQATEIKDILSEIQALGKPKQKVQAVQTETADQPVQSEKIANSDKSANKPEIQEPKIVETITEKVIEQEAVHQTVRNTIEEDSDEAELQKIIQRLYATIYQTDEKPAGESSVILETVPDESFFHESNTIVKDALSQNPVTEVLQSEDTERHDETTGEPIQDSNVLHDSSESPEKTVEILQNTDDTSNEKLQINTETIVSAEENQAENFPFRTFSGNIPETNPQTNKNRKNGIQSGSRRNPYRIDLIFIGVILMAAMIYMLKEFEVFNELSKIFKGSHDQQEQIDNPEPVIPATIDSTTFKPDTTLQIQQDTVAAEPAEKPRKVEVSVFDQPRVYKEFIGTEEVREGSRLTVISERYYGAKDFWVYIYEANRDKFSSPDAVEPGMILKIPKLDPRLTDSANPEALEYARRLHDVYVSQK